MNTLSALISRVKEGIEMNNPFSTLVNQKNPIILINIGVIGFFFRPMVSRLSCEIGFHIMNLLSSIFNKISPHFTPIPPTHVVLLLILIHS